MFKKSDSVDVGDYKHTNPEPIYAESSPAKHILSGQEGVRAMLGASIRIRVSCQETKTWSYKGMLREHSSLNTIT